MPDVFISYRKLDFQACAAVAAALVAEGFSVWWDNDLEAASPFKDVIQEKIQSADAVVVLWSKNAVKSKWVYFETDFAYRLGKLVPVNLDHCEIPVPFNRLHTPSISAKDVTASAHWKSVVAEIRKRVGDKPAATAKGQTLLDIYWGQVKKSGVAADVDEFLKAFPISSYTAEAKALLPVLKRRRIVSLGLWTLAGVIMYLLILAPVVTLIQDYGRTQGFYFSKLYFHYFDFFLIAGIFMIPIYLWSLSKALGYANSLGGARRILGLVCVLAVPTLVSVSATATEISTGYAPWELNIHTLSKPIPADVGTAPGWTALDVFNATDALSTSELSHLLNGRGYNPNQVVDCLASGLKQTELQCAHVKAKLSDKMIALKDRTENRSLTYWSYRAGFVSIALLFIGSFFNIAVHCLASRQIRVWMAGVRPWGGQKIYSTLLNLLALQLGLITIWFVARLIFQLETSSIFPVESDTTTSSQGVIRLSYALFVVVYLVAIGGIVLAALKIYETYARYVVVLISVGAATCLSLTFSSSTFSQAMQTFIGVKASEVSIVILAIVLFTVVFGGIIMPSIFDGSEDDLKI